MDGRSIDTLAAGDFAGLTALTTLDLGRNDLRTLPDDVFDGLTALTGLYLNSNKLRTLDDDVFAPLPALTDLRLSTNRLTTLDAGVFAGLTELQELNLSRNGLNTLDAGVFAGLTALETLRLESNDLVTLDAGVFAGLTALETLHLESNDLATLDAGVFAGLSALGTLRLDDNELATLPDDVFEPLTALTDLQLSDNSGASFAPVADALPDDGTVSHGGGTVTLDGSRSGGAWGTNVTYGWALTAPTSGVTVRFDDDASATTLVTIEALAAETVLTFTLTVTGRGGTDGITPDTDAAKVTVTEVAAAGICGRTPVVRDRILGKISGVSNCALVTDTHLANITGTLNLNGRNIAALAAGDFAGLTSLRVLSLNNNDLTTLADEVFDGLAGLETLNLTDNDLTTLADGGFDGLAALEILNLTDNDLTTLADGGFDGLAALETLNLTNNDLTTLDAGVFDGLTALETLLLQNNDLTTLADGGFDGLTALEILNLRHNQLQSLPDGVFEPLTALTGLDLRNNRSAPFAPTADAQPDSGTVSSAGGRVTLDGSGSDGGPWGMNVTYSWRQTSGPTSGVRLDDDASVTPEATIRALAADTELIFTLTVTGRGGEDEDGVAPATDTAKVTVLLDPTAGVCGRTPAVRDALIAELGVTLCGAVSDADLASITDLTLSGMEFTALAAGDFAGLTSLETLRLTNTALTALPGGVFDGLNALTALLVNGNNTLTALSPGAFAGLTSLETLWLNNNALENLPDGVFAGLTSLKTLRLENNELATLPDDVFEPLTALTTLDLLDNDGAPFSPEAVARPDDGTVSNAGGTVTLDGSDSGGAWGTNVTYSWRQTSGPTSGVTFDDATSATPVVTIPALAASTVLTFTLTVTGRGGTDGITPDTDAATVTATAPPASDDATLSGLTVNDGTSDLTLDPTFVSATTSYAAEVANAVTTVTLTAMTTDDGASVSAVTLNGIAIADSDFTDGITVPSLAEGDNDIVVTVTAEDGSATETYTVTVTRAGAGIPVTIEAEHESIGGGVEDLKYTLARTGATTDPLTVTVTLTQDQNWLTSTYLTHEVEFAAGEATNELIIEDSRFSFDPTTSGNLVATVTGTGVAGGTDTFMVISIADPPITIAFDQDAYTFPEGGLADEVDIYVTATLDAAFTRKPSSDFPIATSTGGGTATSPEDYDQFTRILRFTPTDFTANSDGQQVASFLVGPSVGDRLVIVDDEIYEVNETFNVRVETNPDLRAGLARVKKADGTFCTLGISDCTRVYPVTITDEEDLPTLSLAATPASIAEEDDATTTGTVENVSTVTVEITNSKTFAVDQTVTLTLSGTATQGTHYSVSPGDADTNTADHQVVLVKETASVEVTVTATGNDTDDGSRTVTVAADLDGTAVGSTDITILDDDTTTAPTEPGAPTGLTATASGTSTIDLDWTEPSDDGDASITGYRIEVSPNGSSGWSNLVANTNNTTTTYSHTGLTAGTTRHYRVSAINSVGTGTASSTANATTDAAAPTEPGAPTGLTATASGTSTIDLDWTEPSDDGDASITGYKIEVSPNGSSSSWSDLVANTNNTTTTYSHTGLSAGTTRHYRVSAINSVGTGTASSTANATTDAAAPTEPGAPTGLTATASGTSTINLTWTEPSDDGDASITGYTIEVSPNGSSGWSNLVGNTNNTTTTYSHTGLSTGTTRHYRVSAINSAGTGTASSTANATTGTDTGPLVLTVQAVSATVTEGEPVRYRILMSRPTSGALVESEYSYEGEFVHNGPASVVTGVSSQNGMTYWEIGYETLDDAMVEEDGSFTVRILKPDADLYNQGEVYTVGTPSSVTVTILDNDAEETPTLPIVSVFDVRVDEGPGAVLAFPVRLNVAAVETATIEWETLNGSAKAGRDYKKASGTLVFSPGDTEKTVRVEVIDDDEVEGTEVMLLLLLDAQGAVIDDAVAKGTIKDNDAASDAASDAADDALEDALTLVDDLTPGVAAAVLLGEQTLGEAELAALDRLGNRNGRYDLGDLLSWIDRCRRGEARCGRTSTDSGPAAAALLGGAAAGGRSTPKRPGRRDSGRRGRASTGGIRRRARMAGQVLAVLLAATTAWSCTEGSVAPVAPRPDPGFLTVEWSGPATHRDVGVLLELEGPTIDAVRAPGLELYESSSPGPRRIVVAGVLRPGPLVQLRVPDRNQFALYRVRVLQVTGEGYGLRDPTEYRAVVIMN